MRLPEDETITLLSKMAVPFRERAAACLQFWRRWGASKQVNLSQNVDREARNERGKATGVLVSVGDAEEMARALVMLLTDHGLREVLSRNASADALQRFGLDRMVDGYLSSYARLVPEWEQRRTRSDAR